MLARLLEFLKPHLNPKPYLQFEGLRLCHSLEYGMRLMSLLQKILAIRLWFKNPPLLEG